MGLFNRFYRIQIVSADIPKFISEVSLSGISLQTIEFVDPLTALVTFEAKHFKRMERILLRNGASWKSIKKEGSFWKTEKIWKHPVLLIGIVLYFLAIVLVPGHVFFVEVTGNQSISVQEVLANAEKAGIVFGALTSEIRSEAVKNRLLQNMPQLQWIGVTTRGCVAVIQIKERSIQQTDDSPSEAISSIVAACDGIITKQTVYEGKPLYQVGDIVKEGDTLVSGYIDCGIKLRAGKSNAEIFAYTTRENQFLVPYSTVMRRGIQSKHICYKLRVGKKVINFCNHSGIMDACCVKMYSEDYWSLPGGFQLPVSLISTTYLCYDLQQPASSEKDAAWLPRFARGYVISQMISGEILGEEQLWEEREDVTILTSAYSCHEMIGREKYEGIIE